MTICNSHFRSAYLSCCAVENRIAREIRAYPGTRTRSPERARARANQ
jgi:hypothetical protein